VAGGVGGAEDLTPKTRGGARGGRKGAARTAADNGRPFNETLREEALKCGLRPAEYWALTPSETFEFIEAAVWRATEAKRTAVTGAYFTEAFARTKRLQPLDQLLNRMFRSNTESRSLDDKVEAARRFLRAKKKQPRVS
jgi:hypothetical protein